MNQDAGTAGARRHSVAHRAEYALARTLERAVSALPEAVAHRLGAGIGSLVHSPLSIRRSTVEENLRIAFPSADAAWIRRTADAAYAHLGREAAAILRLSALDPAALIQRTEPEGWDQLEEALGEGKGLILVTGHFGNWEIAAAAVAARGIPISAIVRKQGNRLVDARLNDIRRRLGVETIYQSAAPTQVPRALRRNGVVGIVGDQDARGSGLFVPFFGRPASTHRGPAVFALRFGAPVFACTARRLPGPGVRYAVAGERVPVRRTGDMEADTYALTAELAQRLESAIRQAPEQYFWFHRRWKTAPPVERTGIGDGSIGPASDAAPPPSHRDDA